MTIPIQTKELLLQLRDRLPPERRDAFVASVGTHLRELASSHTAYYALMGGLTGYLLGHLPLVGMLATTTTKRRSARCRHLGRF